MTSKAGTGVDDEKVGMASVGVIMKSFLVKGHSREHIQVSILRELKARQTKESQADGRLKTQI